MKTLLMRIGTLAVVGAALAAAPGAAQDLLSVNERRGLLGVSLSCGDCYVLRGPGQVAYTRLPMISSITRGGAAEVAGLVRGDTLTAADGMALTTPEGFSRLANVRPGEPVRIGYRRGGQDREVTLVPGRASETVASYYESRLRTAQRLGAEALRASFRSPLGWLGVGVQCEQCSVMNVGRRQQAWTFREPPSVLTVDVDGPAHRAGLRRGDVITQIDGVELTTREGGRAFADIEPGQRVTLSVQRDGRARQVQLTAVARPDASREEIAAFEEYRRMRDSSEARYRATLEASLNRAQVEMRQLQEALRTAQAGRDPQESRRRLASLDSVLRDLRELERERSRSEFPFAFVAPAWQDAPAPPLPSVAPAARWGVSYPLRYSGRFANVVNIEARGPGAVNVQEVGDSLVVITSGGVEVKVIRLPSGQRR